MFRFIEFNSIRSRMVGGFLLLTALLLVLAAVSLSAFDRITRISRTHGDISRLQIFTLSLMKSDNDFFDLETINEEYFRTHKSDFLKKRDSLNHLISIEIKSLLTREFDENLGIEASLQSIDTTLQRYNAKFKKLEELVYKKGFKDYGAEGAMRFQAHAVEETIAPDKMLELLFLRRHEKDFLLRSDTGYLTAFKNRASVLLQDLSRHASVNREVMKHLRGYQNYFLELASIQQELGLSSKHGLRNELNILTNSLSSQYYALSEYSYRYSENAYKNIRIFYIALLAAAIAFSVVSGYWISRRLSEPIARLARMIKDAIVSGNPIRIDLNMLKAAVEIRTLGHSFNLLMEQVTTQMNNINIQNDELIKTNRELDNFLYSTAHDLRSPLNSLLGLVNIARRVNRQEEMHEYFEFMENSIRRSENFIGQIVGFSQNKKMEVVAAPLDLDQIISGIFENHQFIAGADNITKIITIDDRIPFWSDRNRVIMIFTNLISNGIKYSDPEKSNQFIKIHIVVNEVEAEIEFIDNGVGIEDAHLKNIFEMFYRANAASNGSGLGLFIFKETLTRLGGHATVESSGGQGTKFFIRIPNLNQTTLQQQQLEFHH